MAKKRRKGRRRGMGNIITTRTSGLGRLGNLKNPSSFAGSFLPPLIGGGLTAVAAMAITKMGEEQQKKDAEAAAANPSAPVKADGLGMRRMHWHSMGLGANEAAAADAAKEGTGGMLVKWAPALGIALGGVAAYALYAMTGKAAGFSAAAGAIGVGGALLAHKLLNESDDKNAAGVGIAAVRGLGAIVPEYGTSGLGAIVMEPSADQGYNAYSGGADVNVRGLGATGVDVSAFGPVTF